MAIQIKAATKIAEKWQNKAGAAGADYEAGVLAPRRDWQAATEASEGSYSEGIQKAIGEKRFSKGVRRAGTQKWQKGAIDKGVTRYPAGVNAAKDDYQVGVEPYLQEISQITLPPKGPKGDPRNIQRVAMIAQRLHAKNMTR
jgi:hypothetical protein